MSLVTDTGDCSRLIKYLVDAIPQGEHVAPNAEWVSVRLDVVQEAAYHMEWLDKGCEEWREIGLAADKQAKAAKATSRVAIAHLVAILNGGQQKANAAARDWLESIDAIP